MNSLNARIGRKIREARRQLGLTQQELATQLNWSQPKLSKVERGAITLSIADLSEIAESLGQPMNGLLPDSSTAPQDRIEHSLLTLFRRLDGDTRRQLVIRFVLELLDEEQEMIDSLAKPGLDLRSTKAHTLMRWLDSTNPTE
jgi:transcriptional regulator with XRE-family HTH domain